MSNEEYLRLWLEEDLLLMPTNEWQENLFDTITAHIKVDAPPDEWFKKQFEVVILRIDLLRRQN